MGRASDVGVTLLIGGVTVGTIGAVVGVSIIISLNIAIGSASMTDAFGIDDMDARSRVVVVDGVVKGIKDNGTGC